MGTWAREDIAADWCLLGKGDSDDNRRRCMHRPLMELGLERW